jgi:hypothetical protein
MDGCSTSARLIGMAGWSSVGLVGGDRRLTIDRV